MFPAGAAAKRQRGDSYQAAAPPAFNAQQQQQQQQQAAGGQTLSLGVPPQYAAVTITFDGGSRNNPGRAGYGYAVWERQRNDKVRGAVYNSPIFLLLCIDRTAPEESGCGVPQRVQQMMHILFHAGLSSEMAATSQQVVEWLAALGRSACRRCVLCAVCYS
jgi:hypothetical protein